MNLCIVCKKWPTGCFIGKAWHLCRFCNLFADKSRCREWKMCQEGKTEKRNSYSELCIICDGGAK